jgi:hypothetical protein
MDSRFHVVYIDSCSIVIEKVRFFSFEEGIVIFVVPCLLGESGVPVLREELKKCLQK